MSLPAEKQDLPPFKELKQKPPKVTVEKKREETEWRRGSHGAALDQLPER